MAFVVTTLTPPADIGGTTAECKGTIHPTGGSTLVDVDQSGIIFSSVNSDPHEYSDDWEAGTYFGEELTSMLSGLTQGTLYYYRAFAHDVVTAVTYYGDVEEFTTIGLNDVVTHDVTAIEDTTATCGGEVIENDEPAADAYGVVWNTTGAPTILDNDGITIDGAGLGDFVSELTDLIPDTTYYVRAYATNEAGTAYGDQKTFTTYKTLNEYDLGVMTKKAGELRVYAIGTFALTPPSKLLLTAISPKRERIEGNPTIGKVQVENLSLEFKDAGGFWKDLARKNFYVKILLNGALFFYGRGRVQKPEWDEYLITDAETRRNVRLSVVSSIMQLQDVAVGDVVANVPTHVVNVDGTNYKVVRLGELILTIMQLAFPTDVLDIGDIVIPNEDFVYKEYGELVSVGFKKLCVLWGTAASARKYFKSDDDVFLGKKFDSGLSLLAAVCNNFGFIPRVKYDNTGDGKHQLYLLTKRRRDAVPVTMGPGKTSVRKISDLIPDRYRFYVDGEPAEDAWRIRSKIATLSPAPENAYYAVNMELLWNNASYVSDEDFNADDYKRLFVLDDASDFYRVENAQAFSYDANAYSYTSTHMTQLLFLYYHEFWKKEKLGYDRTFKQIDTSVIPTNLVSVNEDDIDFNCYINELVQDVDTNETIVELVEV